VTHRPHFVVAAPVLGPALVLVLLISASPVPASANEDIILATSTALRTEGADAAQAILDAQPEAGRDAGQRAIRLALQGRLDEEQGEHEDSLDAWRQALALAPPYASHLRMWIAHSLLASGQSHAALEPLERVRTDPESVHQAEADVLRAVVLSEGKRPAEARIALRRIVQTHPEHPEHSPHLLLLARAEEALSQQTVAATLYRNLLTDPNESLIGAQAQEALSRLEEEGFHPEGRSTEESLAHARWLADGRQWRASLSTLSELRTNLLAAPPPRPLLGAVEDSIAAVLLRADLLEEALASYRERVHVNATSEHLRGLAVTLERLGRHAEAREAHLRRLDHVKRPHVVYRDLLRLAFEAGELGDAEAALSRSRLPSDRTLWLQAWIAYRGGHLEDAVEGFTRFAHQVDWVRGEYWRGRTLIAAGHRAAGLEVYKGIVERSPMGYYGAQAMNRLYDAGVVSDAFRALPFSEWPSIAGDAARIHWPASARTAGVAFTPEGDLMTILKALTKRAGPRLPEAQRALALVRLGAHKEARLELAQAKSTLRSLRLGLSPRTLASLVPDILLDNRRKAEQRARWGGQIERDPTLLSGRRKAIIRRLKKLKRLDPEIDRWVDEALAHLGDWHGVSRRARKTTASVPEKSDTHRATWRQGAPLAHRQEVEHAATQGRFAPELIWALMRVESGFHSQAVSISNARGLLQILPRTGRVIAQRRGDESFALDDLFTPSINITYSAWYLRELLKKFHGQELLAACSYNAGPHNVARWLRAREGLKMDEFVEEIPSHQARRYTKTTLANLQRIRHAYRGIQAIHVSNRLRTDFEDNINF
jgi:soluble lytic murein transglycosylase-like protein